MHINKVLSAMAAVSALAIASPASAQYSSSGQHSSSGQQDSYRGSANAGANLSARIDQLQLRLQAGVQSGSITRSEAMPLRQQIRRLTQLERQFARDGSISGQERGELQRRMRDVRMAIRTADGNNMAQWEAYDREDGYGRDGRWNDEMNDGRYAQPVNGGIAGFIDSRLGGGVRVGQRAPTGVYVLPGGSPRQFRDGNGSYYRTDGRRIYQIDARTQTVVRIYPLDR